MSSAREEAQARLQAMLGMSREQACRAVEEVFDVLQLDVNEYVATRHAELQAQGQNNPDIFECIANELSTLRFRAPRLSARQIRRRIYG